MKTVLFLCSGNYYRSRFAEHLFNHLASQRAVPWRAISSGLATQRHPGNVGPISPLAIDALRLRGIDLPGHLREPLFVTEAELRSPNLVVAVKESEHRPLLTSRFPGWEDRVRYWEIHDLDCAPADEALSMLAAHVEGLIDEAQAGRLGTGEESAP